MLKIKLIIAIDKNGVMGHNNTMPWKLSDDLKQFKKETKGSAIIMGRKTYDSLPGILPDREHIVLSSKMEGNEKVSVFSSIKNVLDYLKESYEDAYIIGGADLVHQFLDLELIDEMIITHVNCSAKGNVKLDIDKLHLDRWTIWNKEEFDKSEKNQYKFTVCKYVRNKKRFF